MLHGLPSEAPWNQTHESLPEFHCAAQTWDICSDCQGGGYHEEQTDVDECRRWECTWCKGKGEVSTCCPEYAFHEGDLKLCEVCGKRYCADHIARMDDLYVCESCAKCVHCGGSAVLQCDLCSDFACLNHQREFSGGIDPDTGYHGDAGVSCWPKCKPIMRAPEPVVELREAETVCPF